MADRNFGSFNNTFIALVVDVKDPYESGRVKIRIYGKHT